MGQIIKFQHEAYNGTLDGNGKPDIDILYPKTSADMVDGLQAFIAELLSDTTVTAVTIIAGTSTARPKIRITLSTGATIESGEITLATTTVYGVTKLSSATNSTSEVLAATPKGVKTAYDLASTANSTANSATTLLNKLVEVLNSQILRVAVIANIKVDPKTGTTVDLKDTGVTATNLVDIVAFNGDKGTLMAIINEGVSFSIKDTMLYINTTATTIITIKILYNHTFDLR